MNQSSIFFMVLQVEYRELGLGSQVGLSLALRQGIIVIFIGQIQQFVHGMFI